MLVFPGVQWLESGDRSGPIVSVGYSFLQKETFPLGLAETNTTLKV